MHEGVIDSTTKYKERTKNLVTKKKNKSNVTEDPTPVGPKPIEIVFTDTEGNVQKSGEQNEIIVTAAQSEKMEKLRNPMNASVAMKPRTKSFSTGRNNGDCKSWEEKVGVSDSNPAWNSNPNIPGSVRSKSHSSKKASLKASNLCSEMPQSCPSLNNLLTETTETEIAESQSLRVQNPCRSSSTGSLISTV